MPNDGHAGQRINEVYYSLMRPFVHARIAGMGWGPHHRPHGARDVGRAFPCGQCIPLWSAKNSWGVR